jgi:hypothetical protein
MEYSLYFGRKRVGQIPMPGGPQRSVFWDLPANIDCSGSGEILKRKVSENASV